MVRNHSNSRSIGHKDIIMEILISIGHPISIDHSKHPFSISRLPEIHSLIDLLPLSSSLLLFKIYSLPWKTHMTQ